MSNRFIISNSLWSQLIMQLLQRAAIWRVVTHDGALHLRISPSSPLIIGIQILLNQVGPRPISSWAFSALVPLAWVWQDFIGIEGKAGTVIEILIYDVEDRLLGLLLELKQDLLGQLGLRPFLTGRRLFVTLSFHRGRWLGGGLILLPAYASWTRPHIDFRLNAMVDIAWLILVALLLESLGLLLINHSPWEVILVLVIISTISVIINIVIDIVLIDLMNGLGLVPFDFVVFLLYKRNKLQANMWTSIGQTLPFSHSLVRLFPCANQYLLIAPKHSNGAMID